MDMIPELYSIICDTYKTMNRTFDVPLEYISADSELEDLGIDRDAFNVIMMNIESRMKVALPVGCDYELRNIGDVITMIEFSK
ncbi:MAG: hypothetical protein K6E72_01045 [Saccharofermentans sp.]|nr:hypothetical protein [Clostridiales bacterium]MCR5383214.1 hypothetical protein [Saccharofermentans sp.]